MSVSSTVSGHPHRPVVRGLVAWVVAFLIALGGLNLIALTVVGSVGPLEFATAAVIGLVVAVHRRRRNDARGAERGR